MGRNVNVCCPKCRNMMRSDHLAKHLKVHDKTDIRTNQHRSQDKCKILCKTPLSTIGKPPNCKISKYSWHAKTSLKKSHSHLLPRDIRAIIVGKSGSGKTVLLTYLLLEAGVLDYENLTICGNSLHQPEYQIINGGFSKKLSKDQVRKIFEVQDKIVENGGG